MFCDFIYSQVWNALRRHYGIHFPRFAFHFTQPLNDNRFLTSTNYYQHHIFFHTHVLYIKTCFVISELFVYATHTVRVCHRLSTYTQNVSTLKDIAYGGVRDFYMLWLWSLFHTAVGTYNSNQIYFRLFVSNFACHSVCNINWQESFDCLIMKTIFFLLVCWCGKM